MERLIVYPFQVRPGLWAELRLPADLTLDEAKRLEAFVLTLAGSPAPAEEDG